MSEVTPEQILSQPGEMSTASVVTQEKSSILGTIFWLIAFTPVGWYWVWKKTTWTLTIKIVVTLISALVLVGLLIETELISTQITGQLTNLGV